MPDLSQLNKLAQHIGTFFLGKEDAVRLALVSILAEGHLLIEDVPGVGKTLLARVLAKSLACAFHRIQFTPDLLPSDLIGASVYHQPTGEFLFRPDPIFANIVLADEINRATPRTQSALLEAMSDGPVSVDGKTYPLEPPFIVIATQNPYEFEGTYALPESQLDRFAVRIRMGYPPAKSSERSCQHRDGDPADKVSSVLDKKEVLDLQKQVRQVRVDDSVADYLLAISDETRKRDDLHLGVSTRRGVDALPCRAGAGVPGRPRLRDAGRCEDDGRGRPRATASCPRRASVGLSDAGDDAIATIVRSVPVPM